MKRWSTDRRAWARVPRQLNRLLHRDGTTFVYLKALEVTEPLWVACCGRRVKIMDEGYQWLFICPAGARHVVTAHCDAEGQPVQWYIDIIESWATGPDGFPWYDDLYLDVIAAPGGQVEIIDQDELEAARMAGVITARQHDLAWREAERVASAVCRGEFAPVLRTPEYLKWFCERHT